MSDWWRLNLRVRFLTIFVEFSEVAIAESGTVQEGIGREVRTECTLDEGFQNKMRVDGVNRDTALVDDSNCSAHEERKTFAT